MNITNKFRPGIQFLPLIDDLKGYSWHKFRGDFFASFAVAFLAIPQAIAYALLAGLPPVVGLFSAIFGTIFTGAFGSSRHLISGPTTGVAILIQTAVHQTIQTYYPQISGAAYEVLCLKILMQIVWIVGLIQITAGFFNIRKILQFVSRSVISGYFAGVAIAIIVTQLFYFCGINPDSFEGPILFKAGHFLLHIHEFHWTTLVMGLMSLSILLFFHNRIKFLPGPLFMLVSSVLVMLALRTWSSIQELHIATFPEVGNLQLFSHFEAQGFDWLLINRIFPASVAIALLSILEVFSVSRAIASKSGQNIQVNQDIYGVGMSNVLLSWLGAALPASGSITRSALNFQAGAKTKLSSVFTSIILLGMVYSFWPYMNLVPLSALAALLIFTTPALIQKEQLKLCLKTTKGDALVFFLTMLSCLIFSLDTAFYIGIAISIGFYLTNSADPHLVEYAFNASGRLTIVPGHEKVHRKVRIIGIGGELFFGNVDLLQKTIYTVADNPYVKSIVLRLNGVYYMDASMCFAILRLHEYLKETDCHLVISGVTKEVWRTFHRSGLIRKIGKDNLYLTEETSPQLSTWRACLRAQELSS